LESCSSYRSSLQSFSVFSHWLLEGSSRALGNKFLICLKESWVTKLSKGITVLRFLLEITSAPWTWHKRKQLKQGVPWNQWVSSENIAFFLECAHYYFFRSWHRHYLLLLLLKKIQPIEKNDKEISQMIESFSWLLFDMILEHWFKKVIEIRQLLFSRWQEMIHHVC
jgi:hypothetical protein